MDRVYTIREPMVQRIDLATSLPEDFIQVMDLFNRLLKTGKLPYIPRKSEITPKEICDRWMKGIDKNITFLAEDRGRIWGSGTLILDPNTNEYSFQSGRGTEYSLIFDPRHMKGAVEITRKVIEEAKKKSLPFILHTSVNNALEIGIMSELGYKPTETIEHYQRYADAGLNPGVFVYKI